MTVTCALALAAAARADVCPVDGTRLPPSPPRPWNAGAGVDSDGCAWSIAADGRRWVVGLDVVTCPGCAAVFPAHDHPTSLSPAQVAAARASVVGGPGDRGAREALERAAALQRAVLEATPDADDEQLARLGAVLLRAAWAARAEAVLGGPDGGYRPRSVTAARAQLEALEERVRRGSDQDPATAHLELALADVDGLRGAVDALEGRLTGVDLVVVARARHLLGDLERRVREARAGAAAGAPSEAGAELMLARGWIRFGDVARRERWLAAARARHGEAISTEVTRVRQACAEEARLLELARACFTEAATRARTPAERARLLFLAGDAARRAGDLEQARGLLARAIEAAPQGRLAGVARALVER